MASIYFKIFLNLIPKKFDYQLNCTKIVSAQFGLLYEKIIRKRKANSIIKYCLNLSSKLKVLMNQFFTISYFALKQSNLIRSRIIQIQREPLYNLAINRLFFLSYLKNSKCRPKNLKKFPFGSNTKK
ncbi:hypothetical protein BpHYR1_033215 [Brachionus plicatilis]|uniref:Uncharacterized protein n=1 Tax=Brachionus plicatilis TaxID=10195 RepID=A0A3M7T8G6_BRAPC|nr:hypothetical protein BpHYR1_033215 [Brachionus plicatilis]